MGLRRNPDTEYSLGPTRQWLDHTVKFVVAIHEWVGGGMVDDINPATT